MFCPEIIGFIDERMGKFEVGHIPLFSENESAGKLECRKVMDTCQFCLL